jgi:hypothetical protein
MATVLEMYPTEEQSSLVLFLWAKGLNEKDIHKEMFPVYSAKFLSRKVVHNLAEKFSQGRSNVDDGLPGAEVAETTVKKKLICWGFRRTDKTMGQVYQCWLRICGEVNVFSQVRISHVLRFISIYDLFTDSPSYKLYH